MQQYFVWRPSPTVRAVWSSSPAWPNPGTSPRTAGPTPSTCAKGSSSITARSSRRTTSLLLFALQISAQEAYTKGDRRLPRGERIPFQKLFPAYFDLSVPHRRLLDKMRDRFLPLFPRFLLFLFLKLRYLFLQLY